MKTSPGLSCQVDLDVKIKGIFKKALDRGLFSGATAGYTFLNNHKNEIKTWAFGTTENKGENRITKSTYFDLASLTKPLVTVLSLLSLLDKKDFSLNTPIVHILKRKIPAQMKNIEIGQLMAHCSGLPAYREYYKNLIEIKYLSERKEKIIDWILNEKIENPPGKIITYSDLGYILLGRIVEDFCGLSLDFYWSERIVKHLGLQEFLLFNPKKYLDTQTTYAATENCPWTGKMLSGVVHDENCRVLGGVAGHAGLFGTIDGVLHLCNHLVRQFRGEEIHPAYSTENLRSILKKYKKSSWMYGFDTPSVIGSSSGRYFSEKSAGHLGFTGTSFWIDLERGISIVLLTNRVHPTRENEGIRQFRPIFHDTVMEDLLSPGERS